MNDFDYDVLQKKITARGARYTNRVKPGCALPSDYLTASQKKKMNGDVKTVDLNKPMDWKSFKGLSPFVMETYCKHLVDAYGANQTTIAQMFGVHQTAVSHLLIDNNIHIKFPRYKKLDTEKWNVFLQGNAAEFVQDDVAEDPKQDPEQKLSGDLNDIAETGTFSADSSRKRLLTPDADSSKSRTPSKIVDLSGMTLVFNSCRSWQDLADFIGGIPIPEGAVITVMMRPGDNGGAW